MKTLFFEARLQESAAAAAAVVVGTVGLHVDEVFFANNSLDHVAQVIGNGVAETLANDLAGVLHRKLDFQVFVPVGVDFQFPFADPLGIVFINIFYLEVVFEVKFFQSGPD